MLRGGRESFLSGLLSDPDTAWESLDILYEKPRVERVWTQVGANRVLLHRIHPCEKPFFHPHPWPSAVIIVSGRYLMELGTGDPDGKPPTVTVKVELGPLSGYDMTDPQGWHSVRPIGEPSLSLMLTGRPWRTVPRTSGNSPLSASSKKDILEEFRFRLD